MQLIPYGRMTSSIISASDFLMAYMAYMRFCPYKYSIIPVHFVKYISDRREMLSEMLHSHNNKQ